jgi:hypothetical protein
MTQASPETSAPHKDTGPTAAPVESALPSHLQGVPEGPIIDPPKSAAADPASAIESLDEQLAQLTAELLKPNAATPVASPPAAATPMAPAALEPPPPIPQAAPVAEAPPTPPAPIPTATVTSPPPSTPATAATAATPASPAPVATPAPMPTPTPAAEIIPGQQPGAGALLLALATLSKPLAAKPAGVRIAIGVVAVHTLLITAALWAYIFFRPAPAPPGGAAFDFAKASLPEPPAEPAPEAAKPETKHEEAKPESGEGEGHEGAKAPEKKHKSPPKPPSRSAKKAEKKPAAEEHE